MGNLIDLDEGLGQDDANEGQGVIDLDREDLLEELEPEEVTPASGAQGQKPESEVQPEQADQPEPPEWFSKMVEEEGEDAALAYADFLAQRQGGPGNEAASPADDKKPEGQPEKTPESKPAIPMHDDEEWAFHQGQIHAEGEYRELDARSNAIIEQYQKAEGKLKVVSEKIQRLEELGDTGGEDTPYKELVNYRTDLTGEMKRLAETWKPLDERLSGLAAEIQVARLVARDGQIVPEISANKRIYAQLIKDGKVQRGTTKTQIIDMISAERVKRGQRAIGAPEGKEKSREVWKKVTERLRSPAKVGGSKEGQRAGGGGGGAAGGRTVTVTGKGRAAEPAKDYSAFAPTVAAMLRRADVRMARHSKGGK